MKSPLALACDLHEIADWLGSARTAKEVSDWGDEVVDRVLTWRIDAADTASRLAIREMENDQVQ